MPGGHTSHVQSLHFSPSATHPGQLVSASWDGTLILGMAREYSWVFVGLAGERVPSWQESDKHESCSPLRRTCEKY